MNDFPVDFTLGRECDNSPITFTLGPEYKVYQFGRITYRAWHIRSSDRPMILMLPDRPAKQLQKLFDSGYSPTGKYRISTERNYFLRKTCITPLHPKGF